MLTIVMAAAMQMAAMEPTAAACPATPAPLPADLAAWSSARPLAAGGSPEQAPSLMIGTRADAVLPATLTVRYAIAPDKPGAAASYGGMVAFDVPAAGRYRVALGAGAWIDMVRDGKALSSVAHGHGTACSGIRKIVTFDLRPGRYLVQIVGSTATRLSLMIVPD